MVLVYVSCLSPSPTLGKPQILWGASVESPSATPSATLGKPQILLVASAESPSANLGKPQILWVASAESPSCMSGKSQSLGGVFVAMYRTTLETQLNPWVRDWVSETP